jgi:hypothetical protein
MSRVFDRAGCLLAGYCFTVGIVAAGVIQIAQAQETVPSPPPVCPGEHCVDHRVLAEHPALGIDPVAAEFFQRATKALAGEFGTGMMFRVTMPRPELFSEQACSSGVCRGEAVCHEEKLSHFDGGSITIEHPPTHMAAKFVRLGCACEASGECHCAEKHSAGKTACGAECAAAAASDCKCCPCSGEACEAKCGEEGCELGGMVIKRVLHHDELPGLNPHKLMQQIAELMAEKSAAQAALAVRMQADEQIGEIYEAMAELLADNAALDARLESQAESRKLGEKLTELAAENARLKMHIELADERAKLAAERAELAHATSALSLENERLKTRLVELEQKQSVTPIARTASKPRGERKQR